MCLPLFLHVVFKALFQLSDHIAWQDMMNPNRPSLIYIKYYTKVPTTIPQILAHYFKARIGEERVWIWRRKRAKETKTQRKKLQRGWQRSETESGGGLPQILSLWLDSRFKRTGTGVRRRLYDLTDFHPNASGPAGLWEFFFFLVEQKTLSEAATTKYCATIPRTKTAAVPSVSHLWKIGHSEERQERGQPHRQTNWKKIQLIFDFFLVKTLHYY